MSRKIAWIVLFALILATGPGTAQEREITLGVDPELSSTGFLRYLLPRFSLKTGIRVHPVGPESAADADVMVSQVAHEGGVAALVGDGGTYFVWSTHESMDLAKATYASRFVDWLTSDVGKRTIDSFTVAGVHPFASAASRPVEVEPVEFAGDVAVGQRISLRQCGRCHVIGDANKFSGIGSTPSFGVLRAMDDWEDRFRAFYFLNPHPAFTQIQDVTEPFPRERPSPIAPVELTLDEVDAILAYVATIPAVDLGAPIRHQ